MAHEVVINPILGGPNKIQLHVYIKGDGVSSDLSNYELIDPADYDMEGTSRFLSVEYIQSSLQGFYATLKFDYLLDGTFMWVVPEFDACADFQRIGSLRDRSGELDGTGKVLLSTVGLADGEGSFIIQLNNR